jgi:hypothetical protein
MKYRIVLIQIMIVLVLSFPIAADEIESQQKSEPEKSEAEVQKNSAPEKAGFSLNGVKDFIGLSFYLQAGYLYNFENPKDQENSLRLFDHKANSFVVDLAEIQLLHKPQKGEVGYKLKVVAGETAKFIHSRGLGSAGPDGEFIDLNEAYVEYVVPLGNGLAIRFGKFATYHGAEVLEAKDNINYSYSNLFIYAIPVTHTGLMASYTLFDVITLSCYLVNGWDNTLDNNRAKTLGLSLGITPTPQLSGLVNFMAGPEQDNNDSDWRFLIDVVVTAKPIKDLTIIVSGDYGHETAQGKEASWHGVNLISKYDILSWFGVGMRLGYFNDRNGVRTALAQELKEIVITTEFRLPMNLILRPEYRHDWSSKTSFHNNLSQDTLGAGMMYVW